MNVLRCMTVYVALWGFLVVPVTAGKATVDQILAHGLHGPWCRVTDRPEVDSLTIISRDLDIWECRI